MRTIAVPEPIQVNGSETFGLKAFVLGLMSGDRFSRDWAGLSAGHRICQALEGDGSFVKLGTADWERLAEEAKAPQHGYPVKPAIGAFLFVRAILEATEDGD